MCCTVSQGLCHAGCCSLVVVGNHVWAGTEEGSILVYDTSHETLVGQIKPHTDRVSCLECVGSHVWSGSGDRTVAAHDIHSFQTLYRLGEQGTGLLVISMMTALVAISCSIPWYPLQHCDHCTSVFNVDAKHACCHVVYLHCHSEP